MDLGSLSFINREAHEYVVAHYKFQTGGGVRRNKFLHTNNEKEKI